MDCSVFHAGEQAYAARMVDADLFRLGRLGMGWTADDLARTVMVEADTIVEWEAGNMPIPSRVLSWVSMYARNVPEEPIAPTMEMPS